MKTTSDTTVPIETEPEPLTLKSVREGRILVAVPECEVPPLTNEIVESTREVIHQDLDSQAAGLVELPGRR